MNDHRLRELRHALLQIRRLVPAAASCSWAARARAAGMRPGFAGGQSLNPGITNYPLAYVKVPAPTATATKGNASATPSDIDARDLITSITGSDLYVRSQASAGGAEINVTSSITMGQGAVRDLDVSPDGTNWFSLCACRSPFATKERRSQAAPLAHLSIRRDRTDGHAAHQRRHHGRPRRGSPLSAGRTHRVRLDAPDSRPQAILLNEGRPQYQAHTETGNSAIFILHVMNGDGTGMHQISFNTNHDFAPSVLNNGQILFSRWELTNGLSHISLYRCNPDGYGPQLFYGANSHATGANIAGTNNNVIQFLNARQRADGKTLAIARPFLGTQFGGDTLRHRRRELRRVQSAGLAGGAARGRRRPGERHDARHDHRCRHALAGRPLLLGILRSTTAPTGCS